METSESIPKRSPKLVYALRRVLSVPEIGVLIPLVAFLWVFNSVDEAMLSRENIVVMLRTLSYNDRHKFIGLDDHPGKLRTHS